MINMNDSQYIAHCGVIIHYGVGIDNNPPGRGSGRYPKGSGKRPFQHDSAIRKVSRLYDEVNSFDYGTIIDGKRYDETMLDQVDWSRYRTLSIDTIKREKIGNCWDFVNYQHDFLLKNGIPNKSYLFVMAYGPGKDDVVTHTFTIFENNKKSYWFENAWYKKRGIHEIKDVDDVVSVLEANYGKRAFDLYEYDPTGLDQGLTDQEFFDRVTKTDPVRQKKVRRS